MKTGPFTIEKTYNYPIEKVWDAITDSEKMKEWYFKLPEFKPEVDFVFEFDGGPGNGITYHHVCRITEVIPSKKLTHSWKYEGYTGESFVTWELFDEGNKTRLKLTHLGLETFPQNNPDLAKENFSKGWTHITGTGLQNFLDKE